MDSIGNKTITPLISDNVSGMKSFYIFFEIYRNSDSVVNKEYLCTITDEKNKKIYESQLFYTMDDFKNKKFEKLFLYSTEPGILNLKIKDKLTDEIVAEKKLLNFPEGNIKRDLPPDIHRQR
jgi:hypothetical protein